MKKLIVILAFLGSLSAQAQKGKILEEIVAVVGDNIVLKSDLETEYLQAKQTMDYFEGDLKCAVLNQLIVQKLYLHKGDLDSVVIDDARVDAEVDRRVQYYASQIGGEQKLEKYLGKSITEYKAQMRPKIKEQMTTQQVQQTLMSTIKVSPTEIRRFFNKIPKDSLPEVEEEVVLGQIVMQPEANEYAKQYAREKLEGIRRDILNGVYSFDVAAKTHSDDKGTAINGGELGYFGRGQMVGPFERVAFKLKKDSISQIVETDFGFHILQYIDRKGEKVNVRHILIKPLIVSSDYASLVLEMKELIDSLEAGNTNFCKVATKHSIDPYTKDNCGFYTSRANGSQSVPISELDPEIAAKVKYLTVGEYSEPEDFLNYDQTRAYRFFYLKQINPAHTVNLTDDYQKIQALALAEKQDKMVNDWIESYKKDVYVWIDDKYKNCKELEGWKGLAN